MRGLLKNIEDVKGTLVSVFEAKCVTEALGYLKNLSPYTYSVRIKLGDFIYD